MDQELFLLAVLRMLICILEATVFLFPSSVVPVGKLHYEVFLCVIGERFLASKGPSTSSLDRLSQPLPLLQ
jgi:hypothetical protein